MTKTSESASGGGLGFFGALTLLFVGLKLTGYIDWPWLWVLSPLWGIILFAILALGLFVFVGGALDARRERKRRERVAGVRARRGRG